MRKRVKVLFLCVGNSCRSQMAEALAKHGAKDIIEASSAGLVPLGEIAGPTRKVLEERGVSVDGQYSKALAVEARKAVDLIVNMTGRPAKWVLPREKVEVEDWDVSDPYGQDLEIYRQICDEIELRLARLAERLRAKQSQAQVEGV